MPGLPEVLLIYNTPCSARGPDCRESDEGILAEVSAVAAALARLGIPHRTAGVGSLDELFAILASCPEPVVFNLVESLPGACENAAYVPAFCEAAGKQVTGGDSPCLLATLNKWTSKAILRACGVEVPDGVLVPEGMVPDIPRLLNGPFIVKPVAADASEGISVESVIGTDRKGIGDAAAAIHSRFGQPALIEELVGNREFNISIILDGCDARVMPIAEIDFSGLGPDAPRIVDYDAKWNPSSPRYVHTPRVIPAGIDPVMEEKVRAIALRAWHALKCRDYARVDMRMDERGRIYVLEVNANPDVSPDAGFAAALTAGGISFDNFVKTMIANAAGRGIAPPGRPRIAAAQHGTIPVRIRRTEQRDRDPILRFVGETGFFRAGELEIAREVLDDALAHGPGGHYQSYSADADGQAVGWICFGATPCTEGTYDIYWIAVSSPRQGKGIGRALMDFAERQIVALGGRMAVIDTSGRGEYGSTRDFYHVMGFTAQARIRDFYAPGDDKVVYAKRFGAHARQGGA